MSDQAYSHQPQKQSIFSSIIQYILIIVVAVGISWVVRTYIMSPYVIPSSSMEPTIEIGDRVFSEQVTYRYFSDVKRGDVVTFLDPQNASITLIKRVIAVEGQTVDMRDGMLFIDGAEQIEPYTRGLPSQALETTLTGQPITYPYTVPEGEIWVMGDNRTNSADSRYFGSIDMTSVTGRAFVIYWPFNRIQMLD